MSLWSRYRALLVLVTFLASYFVLVGITPYKERGDALRAMLFVLSGWAMFAYWRPFSMYVFSRGTPEERHPYSIFMFMTALGINFNLSIALFWRLSGQPYFIINNFVFDLWIVFCIAAMFVAVTVPNLFGKGVPPSDKIRLGSVWLAMFIVAAYAVVVKPDLRPAADYVRAWIDMGHSYKDPD